MVIDVTHEAQRCLQCKVPRCKIGCPVGTPINDIIKMFLDGEIINAGEVLFKNNPLSVICSLVCPHERQCEGHCIKGKKGEPITFGAIEHHISTQYLNHLKPEVKIDREKKVAIIGAGPAGITIAIILASRGYDITMFDSHDKIGGVLRYGIPEYRLPKMILDQLKNKLVAMGIKIRPNTMIGKVLTIDDLFRDGYKAVFVGTGVWKPTALGVKGESLGHVHYAMDYLKNPDVYELGNKLCVIGAGNVAIDVARTALRHGVKEVHMMYRGGFEKMSAEKHEIECAKTEGVNFDLFKTPIEITDEGVLYQDTEYFEDDDGNQRLRILEGSPSLFEANSVIVAISQGPRDLAVSTTTGIHVNDKGLIRTNEAGGTTREGVFASGDVVTGAKTVVEAVRVSKIVADAIDDYVSHNQSR